MRTNELEPHKLVIASLPYSPCHYYHYFFSCQTSYLYWIYLLCAYKITLILSFLKFPSACGVEPQGNLNTQETEIVP